MEVKMECQTHISHLHGNKRELTKRLTSEEGRQLVPVTHTRTLCYRGGAFLWWSFYCSCFRSFQHLVHITPLTQKPHARTNISAISKIPLKLVTQRSHQQGPTGLSIPLLWLFLVVTSQHSSWECLWMHCSNISEMWLISQHTKGHTDRRIHKRQVYRPHMFSMSHMWHLQEHGNLCDWKSRLWLWSRFMTFCSAMCTDYMHPSCCMMGSHCFWKQLMTYWYHVLYCSQHF